MPASDVPLGTIGTRFELEIKDQDSVVVDISGATSLTMTFRDPTGAVFTRTASLVNIGTDGKLDYTSVSGDIPEDGVKGTWQRQGDIVIPAGTYPTTIVKFEVTANLG